VGGAELLARIDAAAFAPQPFAVEQMGPGQLRAHAAAAQPLDRRAVQALGGLAVAQQRPGARHDQLAAGVQPPDATPHSAATRRSPG
jgi:hypothetical protein